MPVYKVTVEFDYYAYVDSESEAIDFARDAASDIYLFDLADCDEINVKLAPRDEGTLASLVYGPKEDMTLKQALIEAGVFPNSPPEKSVK